MRRADTGEVDVFVRDLSTRNVLRHYTPATGALPWSFTSENLAGAIHDSPAAVYVPASVLGTAQIRVYARGLSSDVYEATKSGSSWSWAPLTSSNGYVGTPQPYVDGNTLYVYARATAGNAARITRTSSTTALASLGGGIYGALRPVPGGVLGLSPANGLWQYGGGVWTSLAGLF